MDWTSKVWWSEFDRKIFSLPLSSCSHIISYCHRQMSEHQTRFSSQTQITLFYIVMFSASSAASSTTAATAAVFVCTYILCVFKIINIGIIIISRSWSWSKQREPVQPWTLFLTRIFLLFKIIYADIIQTIHRKTKAQNTRSSAAAALWPWCLSAECVEMGS